jgi:hypothetical protein
LATLWNAEVGASAEAEVLQADFRDGSRGIEGATTQSRGRSLVGL